MNKPKILQLLGLARRSNNLVMGTDSVIENITKLSMIVLANDSSSTTIDKITKKAYFYGVPVVDIFTTDELSKALGKNNLKMIGLSDVGFTNKINELLNEERKGDQNEG